MPTNITGFQMMRRKQAEKEKLKMEVSKLVENLDIEVSGDIKNAIVTFKEIENKELDVNSMTIEEVRAKLTEMNVYFQPNTGEAKLKAKLEDVLNGAE